MDRLTGYQIFLLTRLQEGALPTAHLSDGRRRKVLDTLKHRGLLTHTYRLTDAGRAALAKELQAPCE